MSNVVMIVGYDDYFNRKVKLGQAWSRGLIPIHRVVVCAVRNVSKFRLAALESQ